METIAALQETSVPTILVIAGLFALFLAVGGRLTVGEIPPDKRKIVGVGGLISLLTGICLFAFPTGRNPPVSVTPASIAIVTPHIITNTPAAKPSDTPKPISITEISTTPTNIESVNPSPSETPIILPTSIEVSEPLLRPTSDPICDTRSYVREPVATNTTKTYIRCPVGEVEYSIQVDDFLDSIILECPGNEPQEIKYTKNESRSEGQLLTTFDSDRFTSYAGCKVKITITSNVENIGYTIWQEIISP